MAKQKGAFNRGRALQPSVKRKAENKGHTASDRLDLTQSSDEDDDKSEDEDSAISEDFFDDEASAVQLPRSFLKCLNSEHEQTSGLSQSKGEIGDNNGSRKRARKARGMDERIKQKIRQATNSEQMCGLDENSKADLVVGDLNKTDDFCGGATPYIPAVRKQMVKQGVRKKMHTSRKEDDVDSGALHSQVKVESPASNNEFITKHDLSGQCPTDVLSRNRQQDVFVPCVSYSLTPGITCSLSLISGYKLLLINFYIGPAYNASQQKVYQPR